MAKYRKDLHTKLQTQNGLWTRNTAKIFSILKIIVFSVVSWSARNESRSTAESSSWEVVQQQQQLEQQRSMQQHMQVMQQRETQRQVGRWTDDDNGL